MHIGNRFFALLLAISMLLAVMPAIAGAEFSFAGLQDQYFMLTSGVGGWYTMLYVDTEGAFNGEFIDNDMGDTGDGYPDGTMYHALFQGQFTLGEQLNDYTYQLLMPDLTALDVEAGIVDGMMIVAAEPYGLANAKELVLYTPGAPIDALPEGFLMWANLFLMDMDETETLPFYAIYNATEELAFIADPIYSVEEFMPDWQIPEDGSMTGIAAEVFEAAMAEPLVGISIHPQCLLASYEADSGVVYCYLCKTSPVVPNAAASYSLVYINQDFKGDCTIMWIDDLLL